VRPWPSLLLATLTACTRPASSTQPASAAPPIFDLEVARTADALRERARGPDADAAILALGRIGDPIAIDELLILLAAGDPRAARALGIARLLGADVDAAEPEIIKLLSTCPPADLAVYAEALGRLGAAASVPALALVVRGGPPEARAAAMLALGMLGKRGVSLDDPTRDLLTRTVITDDHDLAYALAYALANEHEPRILPASTTQLAAILAQSHNPEARAVALGGLARPRRGDGVISDPRTPAIHRDHLGDPDFRVRAAAVRALLAFGDDTSIQALLAWSRSNLAAPGAAHAILAALTGIDDMLDRTGETPKPAWIDLAAQISTTAETTAKSSTPDARSRLARIACHARSLLAHRPEWRAPITCADVPAHVPAVLTAANIGRGLGSPFDRYPHLDRLRRDADPRVRAAAIAATVALLRKDEKLPESWLLEALQDPSPAVVGALADAIKEPPLKISDPVRAALVARAQRELTREVELYITLTATISAVHAAVDPCTAGLLHPNFSVRAAARTCVTALTDADPGPQFVAIPPARPPHGPTPGPKLHWRLTTSRGVVDIDLDPAAAPWNVAALVAHTRAGFYDGLDFHRVVPGFVVQGGDPEGTGWGGAGYTLPSEPGQGRFTRGAVGIADAGKDTGGCQFFFMHARAPHLEGRFTRVGHVTSGQDVVDTLLIGNTITRAEILP
jgi:cyclophilin family peptidyl-prolyl cis-trans isomerase/HEAT repeat protein